ncbi:MAG: nitroreductase family protein [Acidimicrobiales bacterium]
MVRQRACRRFTDEPVDEGDLTRMLEAATHAPSAENRQPWVFVVVRDPATRRAIAAVTLEVWRAGGRQHASGTLTPTLFEAVHRFMEEGYGGAPVLVVVAGDGRDGSSRSVLASSVLPAAQNLLLAAAALGYGSSLTTLAAQAPDALRAVVGIPDGIHPFAVVPVGRPAVPLGPPRRKPVHEVAHADTFGTPFPQLSAVPAEPAGRPPPPPPPA